MTKKELPKCPVATTVQIIGSKWKLLILTNPDKKSPLLRLVSGVMNCHYYLVITRQS